MELLFIVGIAAAWYYFSNNKKQTKHTVKEEHIQRKQIEGGYIERTTTKEYVNKTLDLFDEPDTSQGQISATDEKTVKEKEKTNNYIDCANKNISEARLQAPENNKLAHQFKPLPNRPVTQDNQAFKLCKQCLKKKSYSDFFKSKRSLDGLSKWCKKCNEGGKKRKEAGRYKVCPNCNKNRLTKSFFHSTKTLDGLTKWCKYCHK